MTDQISISGLPLSQPLTGSEKLPMDQGPSTVQATAQQIANLAPKTDLGYVPATRTLTSSTGEDIEIPEASATASGLLPAAWISGTSPALFPHIHGSLAGTVYEHVRNVSGAAMPALTPYHVVGNHDDTDTVTIVPADASDPQTMPASGITLTELAASGAAATGHGAIAGVPTGVNTAGNPSGTVLYVGSGVLTPTPPAANVQAVAIVGRSHATTGTLAMLSGPALARVAFSGDYNHLANKPTLGSAAAQDASAFATAAQGSKADTAVQPGTLATVLGDYVLGTDFRLSNDREWIAATVDQPEAEAGTATTRRAWTAQRVRQAVAGWWTATSTAAGRLLVTAADATAQRTALGLGDSATRNVGTTAGTVAAGDAPSAAIATHVAAADPHTQYLRPAKIVAGTNMSVDTTTTPGSVILNATDVGTPGGTSGQLQYNNAGAFAGVPNTSVDPSTGNTTFSARWTNARNSAANGPANTMTGTWFTGGTADNTKPHFLIEPAGTNSNNWSVNGTGFGVNAPSGFLGEVAWFGVNGVNRFSISPTGINLGNGGVQFVTNTLANGAITFNLASGIRLLLDAGGIRQQPTGQIRWNPLSNLGDNDDLVLTRDAAGTLAQRNGGTSATPVPQTFRLANYQAAAGSTDFERGYLSWASNVFRVGTEKGTGGGTARAMELQTDGVTRIRIGAAGQIGFFGAAAVAQPTAIPNATDAATTQSGLNSVLAALRSLGLIAT